MLAESDGTLMTLANRPWPEVHMAPVFRTHNYLLRTASKTLRRCTIPGNCVDRRFPKIVSNFSRSPQVHAMYLGGAALPPVLSSRLADRLSNLCCCLVPAVRCLWIPHKPCIKRYRRTMGSQTFWVWAIRHCCIWHGSCEQRSWRSS